MAYGYYASITVDNSKVAGSGDLTNFPVLISGTYDGTGGEPDLRTVANGGNVENADTSGGNSGTLTVPADLAFFSDEALTTQLDHEIEKYDATTGQLIAWVEVPTLDFDNDTVIYMGYGDAAVTDSQEDINGTWNASYQKVWHMNGSGQDSTVNNSDITGGTDSASGKVGNARDLVADNEMTFTAGVITNLQFWAFPEDHVDNTTIFRDDSPNNSFQGYNGGGGKLAIWDGNSEAQASTAALVQDAWHMYSLVWAGSDTYKIYIDGAYVEDIGPGSQIQADRVGRTLGTSFDGRMDEVRFSTITDANWIATEYNNQNDPSTFYAMGDETAVGGGEPPSGEGPISPLYLRSLS